MKNKEKKIEISEKVVLVFLGTALLFIIPLLIIENQILESSNEDICSQIKATPAWIDGNTIIGYGSGFPEIYAQQSFNDVVNDYLIPNNITFVYDLKCPHCINQINDFGDSWKTYKESGLTKECHIL